MPRAKVSPSPLPFIDRLPPHWQAALPYLALAAAILAAYANVYHNSFLLDDEMAILDNALLRHWGSIGAIFTSPSTAGVGGNDLFYRPLQELLYLVIYQFAGFSTFWFHLPNVLLHAANACLLYTLGRRLKLQTAAAFLGALLWAVHPIQTEAVTYINATVETLYSFFCLAGLCVLAPNFTPRRTLMACPLLALGLLSKETAVVFPLLAIACQFFADRGRLRLKPCLRTWPLWLTIAGYALLRHLVLHGSGYTFFPRPNAYTAHVLYRIYTCLATLPLYAKLILWPSGLHMSRAFDVYVNFGKPAVLGGAALVLAACAWLVRSRGPRGLPFAWGLLWFAFAYAPETGILLPLNALFLEHWMYLPTAGLFLGAGESIARWIAGISWRKTGRQWITGLACLAALALGAKTHAQNTLWRDPITFYSWIVRQGTDSAAVYNNLGNADMQAGKTESAIAAFRTGIRLLDRFPETHHNLALALLQLPDRKAHIPEAIAELKRGLAIDPGFFQSCELLANIYAYLGDRKEEALYRAKDEALRHKFHIPPDIYRQPVL